MDIQLFITLLFILSTISSLLTEAVKVFISSIEKKTYPNLIALISSLIVGSGGAAAAYVWLNIPFTLPNILAIVAMAFAVAIGSMVGYDKIAQLVTQIKGVHHEN